MEQEPPIVQEIAREDLGRIPRRGTGRSVVLGGKNIHIGVLKKEDFARMQQRMRRHPRGRFFLVTWEGSMRFPSFAISNCEINSPAVGVLASQGAVVGSYVWLIMSQGRSGLQQILAHFTKESA